ncbi:hypothetical protein [Pyrodictium delaneyi]|uniref:hypothetical protein n=1 Tax=Pyrodictium delaneyi TaxID=1273541 RepID=UPI00117B0F34|nr:hypothetical protein [Pyrodictium delaneyi]
MAWWPWQGPGYGYGWGRGKRRGKQPQGTGGEEASPPSPDEFAIHYLPPRCYRLYRLSRGRGAGLTQR